MLDSPKPRWFTRPDVLAWATYDWANSAFSTLSITIVVVFFGNFLYPQERFGNWSGSAYAFALAGTTLLAGLLSPIVGALADARNTKHVWLRYCALAGAACCLGMACVPSDPPWLATLLFMTALFFFELSYGFANAFLPDIADESEMNRVSAFGFALGYVGGALALIAAIFLIKYGDSAGWTAEQKVRGGLCIMGLWWGIFSLPAILYLRDRPRVAIERTAAPPTLGDSFRKAVGDVRTTLGSMRGYRMLALFLIGFLLYNDCVQTVISQASVLAEKGLAFRPDDLIKLVLLIQFVALPGSLLIGWLSDRIGQKRVLMICLAAWGAILLSSSFIGEKTDLGYDALAAKLSAVDVKLDELTAAPLREKDPAAAHVPPELLGELTVYLSKLDASQNSFWILGACVALVMGGIQSVSRAIMGTMTPPEKSAEFFGFFNLSSKATCFIGPLIFGGVFFLTGKFKLAILSLLIQLIVGIVVISRVDVEKGRRAARTAEAEAEAS